MSGLRGVQTAAAIVSDIELALFRPFRSIGGFVAQVTIREDHRDTLQITQHPVEYGAAITDHAFKVPAAIVIDAGWTGPAILLNNIYSMLLEMQASRQPLSVYTGKRVYQNMLVAQLHTNTDNQNANTLLVQFILQEIIRVSSQSYQTPDSLTSGDQDFSGAVTGGGGVNQDFSGGVGGGSGSGGNTGDEAGKFIKIPSAAEPYNTAPVQQGGQVSLLPAPRYNGTPFIDPVTKENADPPLGFTPVPLQPGDPGYVAK